MENNKSPSRYKKIEYLTFSYIYTSVFAFSRLSLLWYFMSSFESWYGSSMARFGSSILGSALLLQQFRNPRDELTPPFRDRMPSQRRKKQNDQKLENLWFRHTLRRGSRKLEACAFDLDHDVGYFVNHWSRRCESS